MNKNPGTPAVIPVSPTLADVVQIIGRAESLPTRRMVEMKRDVLAFCGWIGRPPEKVPAVMHALRRAFDSVQHGSLGISPKRLQNVRANLRKALSMTNSAKGAPQPAPLSPAWETLAAKLMSGWEKHALMPFFRFCDLSSLNPGDVDESPLQAYLTFRQDTGLARKPENAVSAVRYAWEKARRSIAGWPSASLAPARLESYCLPLTAFPESFQEDVRNYFASRKAVGRPNEQTPTTDGTVRRYRLRDRSKPLDNTRRIEQSTLNRYLAQIRLAASTLVREREKKPHEIGSIRDVISPDTLALVADAILERSQRASSYAVTIGGDFRAIAVFWLKPSEDERAAYNALIREFAADAGIGEMTEKNRSRLRPFQDSAVLGRLVSLPQWIMEDVEETRRRTKCVTAAMAQAMEAAVGLMIELTLPVRRAALARTQFERNIRWPMAKGGEGALYYTPSEETKTRRYLSARLAPWKIALLRLYRDVYHPVITGGVKNAYVFPSPRSTTHKPPSSIAGIVVRLIRRRLGLVFNLHLFRHLSGAVLLNEDLRNQPIVGRLLGQVENSRSTPIYAEIATAAAAREYERLVEKERAAARPLRRRAKDRRWRRS